MATDGSSIKNDIDNNLANKGYRGVRVSNVISVLKNLVDWVASAVNGNLTTWNKVGTAGPAGSNTDDVYRTGKVIVGRTTDDGSGAALQVQGQARGNGVYSTGTIYAETSTPTNSAMASLSFQQYSAVQLVGKNGGPAFMEFHLPGYLIHQLGVDTDGNLKFHPWSSNQAYNLIIDTLTTILRLSNTVANRRIILYDGTGNDHQFFGLGINNNVLRYQVDSPTSSHVFYAGTSPATSVELMRIVGAGFVGIGNAAPGFKLDVGADNPANGVLAQFINSHGAGSNGSLIQIHQGGVAIWRIGQPANADAFVIQGWGGGVFPERLRVDGNGNVGINTATPTEKLEVAGRVKTSHIVSSGNLPTLTPGAGLGTGGGTVLGSGSTDMRGRLQFNVAASGNQGGVKDVVTVTFTTPVANASFIVMISPASQAAADVIAIYVSSQTVNGFTLGVNSKGLAGPNTWIFNYLVIL
jgi:hypothetical protein